MRIVRFFSFSIILIVITLKTYDMYVCLYLLKLIQVSDRHVDYARINQHHKLLPKGVHR